MKNSVSEDLWYFFAYIPIDQDVSFDDIISKLAYYHNSNKDNILAAFSHLNTLDKQFQWDWCVRLRDSVNGGIPSIYMEVFDAQRNRIGGSHINKHDGHPMETVW